MTVTYRCIGKGVTDENGVAHMTHSTSDGGSTWTDISSNPGYVGTGKGLVDLCASPDDPSTIDESSLVSEPYPVLDALFKDIGTLSDYGTWTSSDFTDATRISRDTECTTLTPQDNYDTQQQSVTGTDFAVEFDCNLTYSDGTSTNAFLRFIASTNRTFYPSSLGLQSGNWHHIKFIVTDGNVTVFVDNVDKSSQSISNPTAFRIVLNNNYVSNMKYKNFVIYPI